MDNRNIQHPAGETPAGQSPANNGQQTSAGQRPLNGGQRPPAPRRSEGLPNPNRPVQRPQTPVSQPVPLQQGNPRGTNNSVQPVPQQAQSQIQQTQQPQQPQEVLSTPPRRKSIKGKIILCVVLVAIVATGVLVLGSKKSKEEEVTPTVQTYAVPSVYEDTGRYAIDRYLSIVNAYDQNLLMTYMPNSWLSEEWEYANSDALRENWIKSICSYITAEYPQQQVLDNLGNVALQSDGSTLFEDSSLLNGEEITLNIVDYDALSATMQEDVNIIIDKYNSRGYSPSDYEFKTEMTNLMLDYLLEKSNFPTKPVKVKVVIGEGEGENPDSYELKNSVSQLSSDNVVEDAIIPDVTDSTTIAPMSYRSKRVVVPTALASTQGIEGTEVVIDDIDELTGGVITAVVGEESTVEEPMKVLDGNDSDFEYDFLKATDVSDEEGLTIYINKGVELISNEDGTTSEVERYVVVDDSDLDELLFSSNAFHKMLDTFGALIYKYEFDKEDVAIAKLEQEFIENSKAETTAIVVTDEEGTPVTDESENEVTTYVEVTEPIGSIINVTDESGVAMTDENGSPITEIYSETTQASWIEPERKFKHNYDAEDVITYTWLGAYYSQNVYEGESNTEAQIGDGTFELPAGVGTSIVTKALCTDGEFHDVRITLKAYYIGENAINYAISFSEKNRGFDPTSQVQLICYEIKVENLEDEPITVIADMFLSDSRSNQSAKTGNMYGFYSEATIQPHDYEIINDWATSTEMAHKYVCWGRSFDRQYPVVWFRLLAGSGEPVPTYDANESFINGSNSKDDKGSQAGINANESFKNKDNFEETTTEAVSETSVGAIESTDNTDNTEDSTESITGTDETVTTTIENE